MTTIRKYALVLALSLLLPAMAQAEENSDRAKAFMSGFVNDAIQTVSNQKLTRDMRFERIDALVTWYFDTKSVGRFVTGRHWRRFSDEQKEAFLAKFKDMNVAVWTVRFEGYDGETVNINDVIVNKDKTLFVRSKIVLKGVDRAISVDWRVREKNRRFYIIDIMIDGISMALSQRHEIASIMKQNGNDFDGLMKTFDDKIAGLKS